ncbi:tetratricopeptide repeat protein [Streptomyces sp. NPDC002623]
MLSRAGRSLGRSGQVRAAAIHYQRLADAACRHLGPDHPDTLGALSCLAVWWGNAGDAAGAAEAYAALLPDLVRVLGPNHSRVLSRGTTSPPGAAGPGMQRMASINDGEQVVPGGRQAHRPAHRSALPRRQLRIRLPAGRLHQPLPQNPHTAPRRRRGSVQHPAAMEPDHYADARGRAAPGLRTHRRMEPGRSTGVQGIAGSGRSDSLHWQG